VLKTFRFVRSINTALFPSKLFALKAKRSRRRINRNQDSKSWQIPRKLGHSSPLPSGRPLTFDLQRGRPGCCHSTRIGTDQMIIWSQDETTYHRPTDWRHEPRTRHTKWFEFLKKHNPDQQQRTDPRDPRTGCIYAHLSPD